MSSKTTPATGEGRLWAVSFLVSLVINALLFGGLAKISSLDAARHARTVAEARPVERWVAAVIPERGSPSAPPVVATTPRPPAGMSTPFARTSPEQESERPAAARFLGERNTRATSDRAPDAGASPLPALSGLEGNRPVQTTESRGRDDSGEENTASPVEPISPPETVASGATDTRPKAAGETKDSPGPGSFNLRPPSQEPLAKGPNPVDVEVQAAKNTPEASTKPMPQEKVEAKPTPKPPVEPKPPEPVGSVDQKKTRVRGSIAKQDTGALDVEDSPSGRYQANVIRAIEHEWQRNCLKYEKLITPGFLTVRFVVESTGKVRSVDFLEAADSSDLQKGFTLDSIREAKIPAMPPGLKKQRRGEPLELTYNFYF